MLLLLGEGVVGTFCDKVAWFKYQVKQRNQSSITRAGGKGCWFFKSNTQVGLVYKGTETFYFVDDVTFLDNKY